MTPDKLDGVKIKYVMNDQLGLHAARSGQMCVEKTGPTAPLDCHANKMYVNSFSGTDQLGNSS